MAFNPGRNVGRVSIRVVPDTTKFRKELRDDLDKMSSKTNESIVIDKARLDTRKVRESLRTQMAAMKAIDFEANALVTIDKAKLKKTALRKSIQDQFDQFEDIRVKISAEIRNTKQFEKDVRDMVNRASHNKVNIAASAHTLAAAQQIRFTARARFVDLFVRVNKASIAAALSTMAALSGARLSWKWIDDLLEKAGRLDKTLPSILNWTSGITALIAALMGGVSGLVGIGQGLFSITPALLVLPGLFLNALGSVGVLIVALKHANEELAVLGDDMNELGGIIREAFWDNARQPIINLVQSLMPQLRNSFRELSIGVGVFSGALADAFGQELAGGRLESIFAGIADGWRVLASGAGGFAGAIVNLSEIAAKYTPRLAAWFVRQANTFDAFLTSIATDGRLESWMETSIASMYDLWDATTGFAGVLAGIWRAADRAGSGGLEGFADMLQDWKRVTNGTEFQTGLTAVFRGSYVAMDAFGRAIGSLGQLFADMPRQAERFVGSAGGFIGNLLDETFKALNNSKVSIGLDGFSAGLDAALAGVTPALQPIADTFGNFLGLLGDLAANLLPAAAGVLADLMPAIDGIIKAIEPVLPVLGQALSDISDELGPALAEFVDAAGPLFLQVVTGLADALVAITPTLASLVTAVADLAAALAVEAGWVEPAQEWAESFSTKPSWLGELQEVVGNSGSASALTFADQDYSAFQKAMHDFTGSGGLNDPAAIAQQFAGEIKANLDHAVQLLLDEYNAKLANGGVTAAEGFLTSLTGTDIPPAIIEALKAELGLVADDAPTWLNPAGLNAILGLKAGAEAGKPELLAALQGLPDEIKNQFPSDILNGTGTDILNGMTTGSATGAAGLLAFLAGLPPELQAQIPSDILTGAGADLMNSLKAGGEVGKPAIIEFIGGLPAEIRAQIPSDILNSTGYNITAGMAAGMSSWQALDSVRAAAQLAAGEAVRAARDAAGVRSPSTVMRDQVGIFLATGVAAGMRKGIPTIKSAARDMVALDLFGDRATTGAAATGAGTVINVNQSLLPGETPQEQRDNLVEDLRWVS